MQSESILGKKAGLVIQTAIGLMLVLFVSFACYLMDGFMDYKIVAFFLLLMLSLLAVLFDIIPVLISAIFSATIWNFFFIEPRFTFRIAKVEDGVLFSMYFLVAIINGVLTFKIKQIEKKARLKEEKAKTLQLYNTLFNSLSHELKTPIAAIIGATDTLIEEKAKLSFENQEELLKDISDSSLRLYQQVENLLNMSRLESGSIQLKRDWCDLNELTHSILKRLELQLRKHVVVLSIENNLPLYKLDHLLVGQAIYNLLYNAALYTPEYSEIFITIKNNSEKNFALLFGRERELVNELNELLIIIEDRGPGFPENEIGNVFNKFYRLENTKPGGTGLGLSITKGFIEAHEGSIELENVPHGARFTIKVPAEVSFINHLKNE